jgi:hypothetical protein
MLPYGSVLNFGRDSLKTPITAVVMLVATKMIVIIQIHELNGILADS